MIAGEDFMIKERKGWRCPPPLLHRLPPTTDADFSLSLSGITMIIYKANSSLCVAKYDDEYDDVSYLG